MIENAESKYVPVAISSLLSEAVNKGFRKMAIVGCPCHIQAIRKMEYYRLEKDITQKIRILLGILLQAAWLRAQVLSLKSMEMHFIYTGTSGMTGLIPIFTITQAIFRLDITNICQYSANNGLSTSTRVATKPGWALLNNKPKVVYSCF
ncbi:MAG: Coenzyme F420 hydrogenase/dehydrogenase, beta subunit C-terminal domain [Dehalococcoidales bacterium]|nr:Coenzyme F420 hydrogenase/dehydrogenase, beta subunit C-terminal domain [Dehalococcoidales bacterium]